VRHSLDDPDSVLLSLDCSTWLSQAIGFVERNPWSLGPVMLDAAPTHFAAWASGTSMSARPPRLANRKQTAAGGIHREIARQPSNRGVTGSFNWNTPSDSSSSSVAAARRPTSS
jgi:hypothetical protein